MNIVKGVACVCVAIVAGILAWNENEFMAFLVLILGLCVIFD